MRIKNSTFFSSIEFDSRILRLDIITIKTYYISKGFLEVQIEDSLKTKDGKVSIFLKIYEGKQYILRSAEIFGNRTIPDETICTILGLFSGDPYNPVSANKNISMIDKSWIDTHPEHLRIILIALRDIEIEHIFKKIILEILETSEII